MRNHNNEMIKTTKVPIHCRLLLYPALGVTPSTSLSHGSAPAEVTKKENVDFFFFLLDHIKEKNNLEKARKFPFSPKGNKLSNCEE